MKWGQAPFFTQRGLDSRLEAGYVRSKLRSLEKRCLAPFLARGFSLLEVMVALAILGLSLTVIMNGNITAIASVERIEGMTHATLLARAKMLDLERELNKEGFNVDDEDRDGDFSDQKHPEIKWRAQIKVIKVQTEKIMEMATSLTGDAASNGGSGGGSGGGAAAGAAGALGGMGDLSALLGPLVAPVAQGIGQNMRLVVLELSWPEGKKARGSFKVNAMVTSKALKQTVAAPGGASGAQGTPAGGAPGTAPGAVRK